MDTAEYIIDKSPEALEGFWNHFNFQQPHKAFSMRKFEYLMGIVEICRRKKDDLIAFDVAQAMKSCETHPFPE